MASEHQGHIDRYHRAIEHRGHHGHNMHLFHRDWHSVNREPTAPREPDPTWALGEQYGTHFLQMHHEMVNATPGEPKRHMEHASVLEWYRANHIAPPAPWDPTTPIPSELGYEPDLNAYPTEIRDAVTGAARRAGVPVDAILRRVDNEPDFSLPAWFTREGVPAEASGDPYTGARKLADFRNVNQLGCCIVYPHNAWHGRIGGAMASTWTAIADPMFYWGVHWHIDRVYQDFAALQREKRAFAGDRKMLESRDALESEERQISRKFLEESRALRLAWAEATDRFNQPPQHRAAESTS